MKNTILFLFALVGLLFYASNLYAADPDAALGKWYTSKEKDAAQITIYKCGDKYCGKISWTKDPELLDDENPDPEKKKRKLLGMDMIFDFIFDPDDDRWEDGFIYNPNDGKTYDCRMWLEENDVLQVKGTVGPKWLSIGKTTTWYRVK